MTIYRIRINCSAVYIQIQLQKITVCLYSLSDKGPFVWYCEVSNQWGQVTHLYVGTLTIIGSDNGLLPGCRQCIIWTNDRTVSIWTLGTKFCEILRDKFTLSFKKMHLKMSFAKWQQFSLGLYMLTAATFGVTLCSNIGEIDTIAPNTPVKFLNDHAIRHITRCFVT